MESSLPSDIPGEEGEETATARGEYREIISRLPRDRGWGVFEHLYQYQGFWCPAVVLQGIMAAQHHFNPKPNHIFVSSFPKCGTTWLKALTFAIVTRANFHASSSPLLTALPHDCIPFLEVDLVRKPAGPDPELPLIATHIPYPSLPSSIRAAGCKIVYIFRDPKDAFVSAWHFSRRLTPQEAIIPLEEAFELFCRGVYAYAPYWDHVLGYWKASVEWPDRVLLVKYEDLVKDTPFYVERLAEFMGFPFSPEELENDGESAVHELIGLCSFENLSKLDVNKTGKHRQDEPVVVQNSTYFRKGKVGDWHNYLTAEMANKIDQITKQKFGGCALLEN